MADRVVRELQMDRVFPVSAREVSDRSVLLVHFPHPLRIEKEHGALLAIASQVDPNEYQIDPLAMI